MPRSKFLALAALILTCVIAAWIGVGRAYPGTVTPSQGRELFTGVGADGWIEDGATLELQHLASFRNKLRLHFDPWRPEGLGDALMKVRVCGEQVAEFAVTTGKPYDISLSGSCEPRLVSFHISNTFQASAQDKRQVGVKLARAEVTTKVGIPNVSPRIVFVVALLLLIAGALALSVIPEERSPFLVLLLPVAALIICYNATFRDADNLFALWSLCASILAGTAFTALHRHRGEGRPYEEGEGNKGILVLLVAIAVLGGGALRFYGLDFGLPGKYHPDETPKINAIMRMVGSEDLNPQYFLHPTLLIYLTYFVNTLFHLFGMDGQFADTARLAGRTVSAIAGTLSILWVYLIGRKIYSPFVGLFASYLLAVLPLHVTCSRYMKEDVLLLNWVLLTILFVLKATKEGRPGFVLFAGAAAGCATGTKYSGALTGAIIAAAPFLASGRITKINDRFIGVTVVALGLIPVFFLITTPYALLDFERFRIGISNEGTHMLKGHTVSITAASQYWMYHFSRSVLPGVSYVPAILGMAGVGLLLWRRRLEDLFFVGLLIVFYCPAEWVRAKPAPQPERYILPCLPFLAIIGGEMLRALANSRFRSLTPFIAMVAFGMPLMRTIELAGEIKYDTRQQMADWMIDNLPKGSKVLVDWSPYGPHFPKNEMEIGMFPSGKMFELLNGESIKALGYDYLVLSSLVYNRFFDQPGGDALRRSVIRNAFKTIPILQEVRPEAGSYGFHNPTLTLFSLKEPDFAKLNEELAKKQRGELEMTTNEKRAILNHRLLAAGRQEGGERRLE